MVTIIDSECTLQELAPWLPPCAADNNAHAHADQNRDDQIAAQRAVRQPCHDPSDRSALVPQDGTLVNANCPPAPPYRATPALASNTVTLGSARNTMKQRRPRERATYGETIFPLSRTYEDRHRPRPTLEFADSDRDLVPCGAEVVRTRPAGIDDAAPVRRAAFLEPERHRFL